MRVSFSPHPRQYLLFVFLMVAILKRSEVKSLGSFDLHFFNSLDGEHFFMFLGHMDFLISKSSVQFICPFLH
jgi:hypothetical protein